MNSMMKSVTNSLWGLLGLTMLVVLGVFLLCEWLGLAALTDPALLMQTRSMGAAAAGVVLLALDALLPIPASLVMLTNGALFGVWLGAALSLLGTLGAAATAFVLGRFGLGRFDNDRGGTTLLDRLLPPEERVRADAAIARWGMLAIVVTRPVPILSETTMLAAGASRMGWRSICAATLLGSLPTSLLYAIAGAAVGELEPTATTWLWPGALFLYLVFACVTGVRMRTRQGAAIH